MKNPPESCLSYDHSAEMKNCQSPTAAVETLFQQSRTMSHLSSFLSNLDVQKAVLRGAAAQISHH